MGDEIVCLRRISADKFNTDDLLWYIKFCKQLLDGEMTVKSVVIENGDGDFLGVPLINNVKAHQSNELTVIITAFLKYYESWLGYIKKASSGN